MKQTLMVKLVPSPEQHKALLETMERFNEACNHVSQLAFERYTASRVKLHRLVYRYLREHYGLSAQMAVRTVGKVVEAYHRDKTKLHSFKPYSPMIYDSRILSFKGLDRVSILTLRGREIMPIRFGEYQKARMRTVVKETDLILRKGVFYLSVVVDAPEATPQDPIGAIGVDLGLVHLAVDSDGEFHSGKQVDKVREKTETLKTALQKKGTESAKRHLKRLSGREARFRRNTNHIISKRLVSKAKDTNRLIALEDLKGIGEGTTVGKAERRRHRSWAFNQLRQFIAYKARLAGVILQLVDPRHTSQACPKCGFVSKHNRRSQSSFICQACGFASNADLVGAINIASRATLSTSPSSQQQLGTSPLAFAIGS